MERNNGCSAQCRAGFRGKTEGRRSARLRRDFPAEYAAGLSNESETIVTPGGSCIVDPFGNFVAGPEKEGEAILVAQIDLGQIVRGKFDLDVVGHYARPDIFQLHVDERPKNSVSVQSADLKDERDPR